ncbi:transposase, partial [Bacillus thuringiensis]|uniref:transposase n=1 Tax=Bacillus thuringiensis TaxID=1428 RepID=UPI001CCC06C8
SCSSNHFSYILISFRKLCNRTYLNNIIEQDHRFIKKRIRNMLGLKSLHTATKMIAGIEAMHMVKKGQTIQGEKSAQRQIYLINELFGLTA